MYARRAIATGLLKPQLPLEAQIKALFRSSEQGAFFDPSDWSTLWQDSAGTLPVTAVGQPVGLMLDKRLGLVRGAELAVNGGFAADTDWTKGAGWVIAGGVATLASAQGSGSLMSQGMGFIGGKTYEVRVDVTRLTGTWNMFVVGTGTANSSASGSFTFLLQANISGGFAFQALTGFTGSIDNISVRELPGSHASQPTTVNRPTLQQDGNGRSFLSFNGTNSWMSTGSIDFTSTAQMTVVAGVRKLSDAAAAGMVVELSASQAANNGVFLLAGPDGVNTPTYDFLSKGTTLAAAIASGFAAPVSSVLTGIGNISGAVARLRANGVQVANVATTQGTGNYGNHPLYLGARAGTSLFFNGNLYSLLIRGATSTDAQIIAAERFANSKTGAWV